MVSVETIRQNPKLNMLRRSKNNTRRRILIICIIISCTISFLHFLLIPSSNDDETSKYQSIIYNLSDSFMMTNIIDQFLDSKNGEERQKLWSLLVQSWSTSFEVYLKRTKTVCSLSLSSMNFIHQYLTEYTTKVLLDNSDLQNRLTGFGLFFDYDLEIMRSKDHHMLHNVFLSPCIYFELIILIMKVQLVLFELNLNYFIGPNTLIGALRHHDIVPWHSIVQINLPLNSKKKFLDKIINKTFELELQEVNDAYINEKQIGFIYKIFTENKLWPQIEIYFFQDNSNETFDSYYNQSNIKTDYLQKNNAFPLHLRPFGPILLISIPNHQALISMRQFNVCQSISWNHQLGKPTDMENQWRIPCEQLYGVYPFVQPRHSWRRGYCEETLKTKRIPFKTLSYFRSSCQENITYQLG